MIMNEEKINLIEDTPLALNTFECTREIPHYHRGLMEIVFCLKGNAILTKAGEEIYLKTGEIAIIDAEDIHSISSEKKNLLTSFYFDLNSHEFQISNLQYLAFVSHQNLGYSSTDPNINKIRQLLLSMLYYYVNADMHPLKYSEMLTKMAIRVITLVHEYLSLFSWSAGYGAQNEEDQTRLERVFSFVYTHYNEKITISQLAEMEEISYTLMSNFIKKTSFLGLKNLKTYVKAYKAEILLLTTNHNISDIARECGFSDPKFFYKGFEKWYGRTPAGHRRWYAEYRKDALPNKIYSANDAKTMLIELIPMFQAELSLTGDPVTAA